MGQQQLLLVILVTVIVGIATVVAINTFSSASEAANRDSVTNDVVAIAAAAQSFYIKPEMLNGGGNDFTNINFQSIAFAGVTSGTFDKAINVNGTFEMSDEGTSSFKITAKPASCTGYNGAMPSDSVSDPTYDTGCTDATKHIIAIVRANEIEWTTS